MAKTIVAICGRRRCGKDTLAEYLVKEKGFINLKIADKLKKVSQILFGFTARQVEVDKEAIDVRWGISPRHALQFLGTEVMQYKLQELLPDIGRKFWIRSLIADEFAKHDKIVISDMRFLHEWEELQKMGAFTIKVVRKKDDLNECDNHSSEVECDSIPADVVIHNDKDIKSAHDKLEQVFTEYQRVHYRGN